MALPDPPSNTRQWTPELVIQVIKELVTAVLGLTIVIFTVTMANRTFGLVGRTDTDLTAAKDLLLLMLGLAGVVVGYYFGRVPADARAAQAQQQANAATTQAEQVSAQAKSVADEIDKALDAAGGGVTRGGATGISAEELRRLRDKLRYTATR